LTNPSCYFPGTICDEAEIIAGFANRKPQTANRKPQTAQTANRHPPSAVRRPDVNSPMLNEAAGHACFNRARAALGVWTALAIGNSYLWTRWVDSHGAQKKTLGNWFTYLALIQGASAIFAIVEAIRGRRRVGRGGVGLALGGVLAWIMGTAGWFMGLALMSIGSGMGGAWGRPLRVRGRQLHPELSHGDDWTRGDRPCADDVDLATRRALSALWLHDAQKEHASVPALARVSWLLSAVGAPPELLRWTQRASLEEIDHAERCFALAAGYGGQTWTVEPMPELLIEGIGRIADPLTTLVYESICDGGQLEDFNADVAAQCALVCREPVTRAVLEQIAREERSHAELSWAIVEWVARRDPVRAHAAAARAVKDLDQYPRPTATSPITQPLVARADASTLRAHGRLLDAEWAALWDARLVATRAA
jgi:hypothetical protein